jgi:hypothetical protein
MSVTTTANPIHYTLESVLADYHLHHTEELDTSLNTHPAPSSSQTPRTPSDWPTEHRRVPAYRPVNTELDQSERRVYLNGIERAFVGVMFTGVFLESVGVQMCDCMTKVVLIGVQTVAQLWRSTLGRVWNVGYKVGGEW